MHSDILMYLVSNERRENALDNEAYSLIKSILLIKRVSFLLGNTVLWLQLKKQKITTTGICYYTELITRSERTCNQTVSVINSLQNTINIMEILILED